MIPLRSMGYAKISAGWVRNNQILVLLSTDFLVYRSFGSSSRIMFVLAMELIDLSGKYSTNWYVQSRPWGKKISMKNRTHIVVFAPCCKNFCSRPSGAISIRASPHTGPYSWVLRDQVDVCDGSIGKFCEDMMSKWVSIVRMVVPSHLSWWIAPSSMLLSLENRLKYTERPSKAIRESIPPCASLYYLFAIRLVQRDWE